MAKKIDRHDAQETAPISARIIPWDARLGVSFRYANGKQTAPRRIEAPDWLIIRELNAKKKLTYSSENIRRRAERALGLNEGA